MEKIICDSSVLSIEEGVMMGRAIKTGGYHFEIGNPRSVPPPAGVSADYLTTKFHSKVLGDRHADYRFFLFCFGESENFVKIPVGLFGYSQRNKIRYPIIIGSILTEFIKVKEKEVAKIIGDVEPDSFNLSDQLHLARKSLISRLFYFLASLDNEDRTVMSWPIRVNGSLTRSAAESIPSYSRFTCIKVNLEYYFNGNVSWIRRRFVRKCVIRCARYKFSDNNHGMASPVELTNDKYNAMLFHFYRNLLF